MLNLTVMTGRLTADPELRYTEGANVPVCNFSIANQRNFANAEGERETDFFNYVAWRSNAEFICKYFKKGSLITLVSAAQTRRFQDNETGKTRVVVEFIVNRVEFAESKRSAEGGGNDAASDEIVADFGDVSADDDLPF